VNGLELPFSQAFRHSAWAYPLVEVIHISGFVLLVGAVFVFDLRALGLGSVPLRQLARSTLPWSVAALALVVPSGLMLFLADPNAIIQNPAFVAKLSLLGMAGLNAAAFHVGPYQRIKDSDLALPLTGRVQAGLSMLLWVAVIGCGRMIAYV
jgi:hypothetical protein